LRKQEMRAFALLGCTKASGTLYVRSKSYIGVDFFAGWTFWTDPDPSGGVVQFVGFGQAAEAGLVNATADRVYLGVDMEDPVTPARRSVRIQSRATFNEGLFVATVDHVPTGCGLWPAFWMYGEDPEHIWPAWGEYDIIEGVHTRGRVMTSLHTNADCDQSSAGADEARRRWLPAPSGAAADNCNIYAKGQFENQGCSQQGPHASIGPEFNARGGGTYAAEWDPAAKYIRTWFWPRGHEPTDLLEQRPDPDFWGAPYSYFSLDPYVCSPRHFVNMRLVFDITFCGDLGGPTFQSDCPDVAMEMGCPEFVGRHPEKMRDAYWSIRALDVYQQRETLDEVQVPYVVVEPPSSSTPSPRRLNNGAVIVPILFLGLAVATALALMLFMRWKTQPGDIRCMALYTRCGGEVSTEDDVEDRGMNGVNRHAVDQVFQAGLIVPQHEGLWVPLGINAVGHTDAALTDARGPLGAFMGRLGRHRIISL